LIYVWRNMRRAKIIATIGPASESLDKLRALALAGMNVARLNMSHGEPQRHSEVILRLRQMAGELLRPIALILDLSGPKIRTGRLTASEVLLEVGTTVRITVEDIAGDATHFSANYPLLPREVHPGDRILISDGELELQVLDTSSTEVIARVVHGGPLGEHKGINLPGAQTSIPSITDKDRVDLKFGIERGVDFVAQSFVRSAADCRRALDLIRELGGTARLIAKIEKPEAVDDLANILDTADGVMVARGDLAVETSPERVPVLQKKIISEALVAEKTVITATQMLQSMIENPRPTRAEASDIANAIIDGSEALMLSGETAIGRFPVESVIMMDRIIRSAEDPALIGAAPAGTSVVSELGKSISMTALLRQSAWRRQSGSYGRAIAEAAAFAANEIGCRLIVVFTQNGHMARHIAALRPGQRIIALTPSSQTYAQLALSWGVEPYKLEDFCPNTDELLARGDRVLLHFKLAEADESVVVMAGRMNDVALSNSMKLHRIGLTP